MTEDLLDLARLESGHLRIGATALHLHLIIDEAVEALYIPIGDKFLTVITQWAAHL